MGGKGCGDEMKFKIEIDCDNVAFEGEPLAEIARILRDDARKMQHWVGDGATEWDSTLRDCNDNKVGTAKLSK